MTTGYVYKNNSAAGWFMCLIAYLIVGWIPLVLAVTELKKEHNEKIRRAEKLLETLAAQAQQDGDYPKG